MQRAICDIHHKSLILFELSAEVSGFTDPPASASRQLRVKGRCGRQADGTAGLPPASEIPLRSGTYVSCHKQTKDEFYSLTFARNDIK
jgi:hypothetical protein